MQDLSFEYLPHKVEQLRQSLERIENYLIDKNSINIEPETDQWFNLSEFCQYHPDKPAKATVYSWVNAGSIPYHKNSKKLRFRKSEIDAFLVEGKYPNFEAGAETSLSNHK
jgi:excisionase family DNA binding protein